MHSAFIARRDDARRIPIWFVTAASHAQVRERLEPGARAFAAAAAFEPHAGRHLLLPGADGLSGVLFGLEIVASWFLSPSDHDSPSSTPL